MLRILDISTTEYWAYTWYYYKEYLVRVFLILVINSRNTSAKNTRILGIRTRNTRLLIAPVRVLGLLGLLE